MKDMVLIYLDRLGTANIPTSVRETQFVRNYGVFRIRWCWKGNFSTFSCKTITNFNVFKRIVCDRPPCVTWHKQISIYAIEHKQKSEKCAMQFYSSPSSFSINLRKTIASKNLTSKLIPSVQFNLSMDTAVPILNSQLTSTNTPGRSRLMLQRITKKPRVTFLGEKLLLGLILLFYLSNFIVKYLYCNFLQICSFLFKFYKFYIEKNLLLPDSIL